MLFWGWAASWENRLFAYAKTKTLINFAVTAKLISAFVFAIRIVQFLFYLNTKFQASSHLLSLCSLICVGPDGKPRRTVFSQRGSFNIWLNSYNMQNVQTKKEMWLGNLPSVNNAPSADGSLGKQTFRLMIKVCHIGYQLYAHQTSRKEFIARNINVVLKSDIAFLKAAVSRSDCWIFAIAT